MADDEEGGGRDEAAAASLELVVPLRDDDAKGTELPTPPLLLLDHL